MWQVIGQTRAVALLKRSLEKSSLSHAYLLVGPPRVGKMTLARNLAQAVNCQGEEPPCGKCISCQRIAGGKHSDVWTIGLLTGEKAEISIDQVREIRSAANLPPYEGKSKVFILDGAEHLSAEASNCLLKTLEEPPPQVLFLLLTAKEKLLLPTIASRCQRIELRPLPLSLTEKALVEMAGVSSYQAKLLARLSRGCLGWALSAAQDGELLREREERLATLLRLSNARREARLAFATQLALQFSRNRESVQEVLDLWVSWWRDLLLIKGGGSEFITNIDHASALGEQAQNYSLKEIEVFLHSLQAAKEQLDYNANPRLVLEVLMLSLPRGSRDRLAIVS